ncbi:TetR family transcriptional regulator [Cnuibacter physcomitrellae]|uniref:TetR family transcriptional regulator n=1 Tax=Cnuibacter physcomitrellae TaxID=1619308 RepID=A0A1X9LMN6_9MICO|nr:TetR/AcrR family transcriptional regulator [Cnuibacter physcomitrellae]ARJ06454.1 TetR family transcriptional regulator [Cnuibacter physcomitrellae]GGI38050.1 TetR family transcriptional regulator [Cnuibacter physcomitrellae]
MGRWEPNAPGRLTVAALDLYVERGYEQTTVAEIAARAGVTERTFFRHFTDKREVLFDGSSGLIELLVDGTASAPTDASPLEAVQVALEVAAERFFEQRADFARKRQRVLAANPPLAERELMKLTTFAAAISGALRDRGVPAAAAQMAAEAGMVALRVAFSRWAEGEEEHLTPLLREAFADLRAALAP